MSCNTNKITLVTVGLSAGVEGKKAERIKVKKQELADKTLTMPASVSAKAAWKNVFQLYFQQAPEKKSQNFRKYILQFTRY